MQITSNIECRLLTSFWLQFVFVSNSIDGDRSHSWKENIHVSVCYLPVLTNIEYILSVFPKFKRLKFFERTCSFSISSSQIFSLVLSNVI